MHVMERLFFWWPMKVSNLNVMKRLDVSHQEFEGKLRTSIIDMNYFI